jgi:divinyl protochlorophyllide a 8-vinyl-reductase
VLAHRIPRIAQTILRVLPDPLATRAVLSSIAKHTWTFAGSATVVTALGPAARIAIKGCPTCRDAESTAPICDYYAASFEGLFRELVTARASVIEVECSATGAERCVFEIRS